MLMLNACETASENKAKTETKITPNKNGLLDELNEKIKLDSTKANLYFARAQAYLQDTLVKPAISDLRRAIALDSLNTTYHMQLSDVYFNTGEMVYAIESGKTAHRINNRDINIKNKLAKYYLITQGYENAIILCRDAHVLDPTNADAYFIEAMIYAEKDDEPKCIEALKNCTAQDPEYTEAYMKIATIYNRKKDVLAIKYYDYAIKSDTTNMLARYGKAMFYQENNQIEKAIITYNEILQKDKNYTDAYYNLGYLYLGMDSIAKAKRHFEIATKVSPANSKAYYMKGLCSEALKDYVAALIDYKQSLNFDDKNNLTIEAIARMEKAIAR
jgi:tetratricopeptide (TPR) repeat protein